jgi:prepilin-type N-terminal cleavage/methylation domain-containing protein
MLRQHLAGSQRSRHGLTLMEVIIAMVIFLMSAVAIGNLLSIGSQRALEAQIQAQALERCQSKMSEVICGWVPVTNSTDQQPFDDDPNWIWSMSSTQQDAANLYLVQITVSRADKETTGVEVSLTQMIVDPAVRGGVNNNNANGGGGTPGM